MSVCCAVSAIGENKSENLGRYGLDFCVLWPRRELVVIVVVFSVGSKNFTSLSLQLLVVRVLFFTCPLKRHEKG